MVRVKPVKLGKTERMSFAQIKEVLEMPNLIEVQKNSYNWFLKEGLKEVLEDISNIKDYSDNLVLEFLDYRLGDKPKYSTMECKERDATYSAPLKMVVRLLNKETGEIKEQEVFMGDFPVMTDKGTFIINGAERVIVSQLVRSPSVYYNMAYDKVGKELFSATVIPNRGAWIEYETDSNDIFSIRIDKNRKLPVTILLKALGIETEQQILEMFGNDDRILATLGKDNTSGMEEAILEVHRKIRPGEPPTVDGAMAHLESLFFDPKRYDISRVGRHKYNKKLAIENRITGRRVMEPIIAPLTGELLADVGEVITREMAENIQKHGVDSVTLNIDETPVRVFSNGMVNIDDFVKITDRSVLGWDEMVNFKVLNEILEDEDTEKSLEQKIKARIGDLIPRHITRADIFASINYLCNLGYGIGEVDDIDHLGNRRVRAVGELLQNQFRIGFSRMERVIRERMNLQSQDMDAVTPQSLINIRPVVASIREFFGSSPLSQFMDQTNPLSELTHKRRLSALGPGGLSRDRAGYEVRDVHYSHYGRMCPVETPEGPNIGLISYLANYARINEYGFIEAPFRKVDKETGIISDEVEYMTADVENDFVVAQVNEPVDEYDRFVNARVNIRYRDQILEVDKDTVDYMDVSPQMMVSVGTSMIPFLENDDASRALMGSSMQKQAVPLLKSEAPIVGTGMEYKAAVDSGVTVLSEHNGIVEKVSSDKISIRTIEGKLEIYELIKFQRSNQGTCVNQKPIVFVGENVKKGDVIADGPSTSNGEIALGKNVLIGFMSWEGYNYEDAVLISERLVHDDVYTSIHIDEYEIEARDTKLGPEEVTRDIPNVGEDMLKNLDENGIIYVGAEVKSGDILVGKVTPKGETELTAEERLLRAIFGEKAREVRDASLRVPHGENGIVVDVKIFTRETSEELRPGVNMVVRCYVAKKRKISVGDKMAGRHGNKGVISRILPREDMPFLPDGTPLDIVLNPLGVPSRMNIGQVLEIHMGYAAHALGWKIMTPVFDGANEMDIVECLKLAGLSEDGKTILHDGRTGEEFDNPVTAGYMYFLKLDHLVDDKIHARSTGPYSLVTQQPLGGKAQFGGQRFGEMEVWALYAHGAAYTLQEILTVKSDDIDGRVKTYEAIVKGDNIPKPGIPESFKVLVKEMQSLAIDVDVYNRYGERIDLKVAFDEEDSQKSIYNENTNEYEENQLEVDVDDDDEFNINVYETDMEDIENILTSEIDFDDKE